MIPLKGSLSITFDKTYDREPGESECDLNMFSKSTEPPYDVQNTSGV